MRLNYFLCFSALVQLGNFSKAAESLFMTQSAFSKQINAMEAALGIKLFDRSSHGVSLTPAGAQMVTHVNTIIDAYNQIHDIAKTYQNYQQVLRIASIYNMALNGIVDMIVRFEKGRENFHVESRECSHTKMYELLKTHSTDIIIGYRELLPIQDELIGVTLRRESLVVVANSQHPFAMKESINLREVQNERFCLPQEDSAMFAFIKHFCGIVGFAPWLTKSDVRIDTIKRYILADMRMTIVSNALARNVFREKDFKIIPIQDSPELSLTIFADYDNIDKNGVQFIQFVEEAFAEESGAALPQRSAD